MEHVIATNQHSIVMLARNASKVEKRENLTVIQGDATSLSDVKAVCKDCDVVVSCAGNNGSVLIMEKLANSIVSACEEYKISRAYFMTSLGIGGSSPFLKILLSLFLGFERIKDYEAADKCIVEHPGMTVVRPTQLIDKGEPSGTYWATSETGMQVRGGGIHKEDVGLFRCDEIVKDEWSGKPVQLYNSKTKK